MRPLLILLLFFGVVPSAYSQVYTDPDSADAGAGNQYRQEGPTGGDSNTAVVGQPYYGYPYYYGSPYYYRRGVQAVPDANDPNYFPPEAGLTTGPNVPASGTPPKVPVKKTPAY